jgi:hypothetical protein
MSSVGPGLFCKESNRNIKTTYDFSLLKNVSHEVTRITTNNCYVQKY